MRVKGIEPPLPEGNQILSLARLPVPPHPLFLMPASYSDETLCPQANWLRKSQFHLTQRCCIDIDLLIPPIMEIDP